jgi:hypothetical protein
MVLHCNGLRTGYQGANRAMVVTWPRGSPDCNEWWFKDAACETSTPWDLADSSPRREISGMDEGMELA